MSFNPINDPVDHITLKGRRSPGVAVIQGASANNMWDERRGFALSGARLRFRGRGLAKFIVRLTLASQQDWDGWNAFRPLVQQPPIGVRARAMDIYHPILEDLGISSVVVDKHFQPVQSRPGEWQIDIAFIEQRPPAPVLVEVEGSAETPQPLSALELQIREATDRLARTVEAGRQLEDELQELE